MTTRQREQFLDICRQEVSLLEPFVALLKEEKEALSLADILAADLIADRKQLHIEKLTEHAEQRNQLFHSLGLTSGALVRTWVKDGVEESQLWEKLTGLLIRARDLNETNIRLLRSQSQQVEESIAYFKQHVITEEYDADGELSPDSSAQRDFGSA